MYVQMPAPVREFKPTDRGTAIPRNQPVITLVFPKYRHYTPCSRGDPSPGSGEICEKAIVFAIVLRVTHCERFRENQTRRSLANSRGEAANRPGCGKNWQGAWDHHP